MNSDLTDRDLSVNWHPFTQMKNATPPIVLKRAEGAHLIDESGRVFIDGISSWWVNIHGHCHPAIMDRMKQTMEHLDHVCFAGWTHAPAVELSENLISILPENQKHIFYSDNGSTAVEVGLKMALQYWANLNQEKSTFVTLRGGYHGDTFGAMSVSERSTFTKPFLSQLFKVQYIDFPRENSQTLNQLRQILSKKNVAAFIYEPLVQGVSGFQMYSPTLLNTLISVCHEFGVLAIADEVMTGFGRTGTTFASDQVNEHPDIVCLSKALTGGVLPLGATSCTANIFEAFLSHDPKKMFFHGHSFTANPIACSAALASLGLLKEKSCQENILRIHRRHKDFAESIAAGPAVKDVRVCGTILAIEIQTNAQTSYFNELGPTLSKFFLERGVWLRPLGNVIYVIPPYVIEASDLEKIYGAISEALTMVAKKL